MAQASGNPKLARLVAEWLQASGKTLKVLSANSGINASHLSLIKSGRRGISETAARKLADALHPDDRNKADAIYAQLIEAANSPRDVAFPVLVTTTVQLKVPAHSVGLFGDLQSKIHTKEILTKSALIEFESVWDVGGEIYIYAEQGKALEIHDRHFMALTSENITERKIRYNFAFDNAEDARHVVEKLSLPRESADLLNVYGRRSMTVVAKEWHDPFELRRICIIYTAAGKNPVGYEKILDDPLLFHRIPGTLAIELLTQYKTNLDKQIWRKLKPKVASQ